MAIRFLNSQSIDGSLTVSGQVFTGNKIDVRATSTEDAGIDIGVGRTGNGFSYLDFVGNTTWPTFGLRLSYNGANGNAYLNHRGSGGLFLRTTEVAPVIFQMNAAEKMRVATNGKVGIGTTNPLYGTLQVGDANATTNIAVAGTRSLFGYVNNNAVIQGGSNKGVAFHVDNNTFGSGEAMRIDTDGNVGINNTSPDYELDVTGDIQYSGTLFNGPRQEYVGSNFISANQAYTGSLVGSYFVGGDYQKIVTIIPSGASQNYQIVGNIYVQSGALTQVIEVNASLRSNTLPDLSWEIYYEESNTGTRFVKPFLWTKETTTAGFIFGIEVLSGITIYGNVTADLKINSRSSGDKANVSINTVTASDQLTIDTGYTQREFTQRSTWDEENLGIGTTSPSTLLHVSSTTSPSVRVTGLTSNNSDPAIELLGTGNTFSEGGQMWYDNSSGVLHISSLYNSNAADIQFHTKVAADRSTSNTRMTIAGDGNVGIGTTNPGHLLDVQATTDPSIRVRSSGTGSSDDALVRIRIGGSTASSILALGDAASSTAGQIRYTHSVDAMRLYTSGAEKVRIDSNGNVGIGVTNPNHKLQVYEPTNLGSTAGDTNNMFSLKSETANADSLNFTTRRNVAGSNWETASHRIQRKVDATLMGYLQFGSMNGDLITFGENATEYMRIDGSGRVGIGNNSPSQKLHVSGNARVTGAYYDSNNSPGTSGQVLSSTVTGTDWINASSGGGKFVDGTDTNDAVYTIGNVGIGTASPGSKLEVVGEISASSGNGFKLGNSNQTAIGKWYNTSGVNFLEGDSTRSFQIGSATNGVNVRFDNFNNRVGIGTTSPSQPLHVTGNILSNAVVYADTGIYSDGYIEADGNIKTYNNILVDGDAGIGTTSPSQKLHVSGNARVTGAYYDSNNLPGTSGQVLSSTATGTSWVNEGSSVGVSSIIAGTNITISPTGGTGAVTINASSGGGGGGSRTASFNSAFFQSGTGNYYLPISTESEQTSRQRGNTIVPPFNAYLKSVTMTHSSINAPTSGTRTLTMQDSTGTTIEAITVNYNDYASVGVGRYTWTFTFTSSAQATAGRPFWIYGTNNFNVGWGNAIYTILLEEQ